MFHKSPNVAGTAFRDLLVGETSWSRCNRAVRLPGQRRQKASLHRRARALAGFHTRRRTGVPRHRVCTRNPTRAGDRPPRYEKITPSFHRRAVGKPVPRHRSLARPCKSSSPDPEPFVIRRAQTTVGETHIVTMALAGDRPPHYDKKRFLGP